MAAAPCITPSLLHLPTVAIRVIPLILKLKDMASHDPFLRLSFKCAGNILFYLDPTDIARCEGVSRGWGAFVRAWIASSGFSSNFPGLLDRIITKDPPAIRRSSKTCFSAARQPSGIEASDRISFAGDYAAWHREDEIHWQRMSFREDGSLYNSKWLPCVPSPAYACAFMINEEGYLVLQRSRGRGEVDVFSLEEGGRIYTMNEPRLVINYVTDTKAVNALVSQIGSNLAMAMQADVSKTTEINTLVEAAFSMAAIEAVALDARDWEWVVETALASPWALDVQFFKFVRAPKVSEETYGHKSGFYLKAAVKYITAFRRWEGYGKGVAGFIAGRKATDTE
ncbi:hypothetical protein BJX68DRAFT_273397 [Aspergillus pseudodeflectus]|uniref:F-box domain-containing protein n=1 Tax=Aspergillus pseudodeflectus TaxID=176178 RepID=A0ABR4J9J1_9EURO